MYMYSIWCIVQYLHVRMYMVYMYYGIVPVWCIHSGTGKIYLVVHESLETSYTLMLYSSKYGIFPGKISLTTGPECIQQDV